MHLSKKRKTFYMLFFAFSECTLRFEPFQRTMNLLASLLLKLMILNGVVTEARKRSCFSKPFDSKRVNESQKLLKPAENQF